jgi:hypothetical protein
MDLEDSALINQPRVACYATENQMVFNLYCSENCMSTHIVNYRDTYLGYQTLETTQSLVSSLYNALKMSENFDHSKL